MSFSVGVLYSAQQFLEAVGTGGMRPQEFESAFRVYEVAAATAVLGICQDCGWVALGPSGALTLTDAARAILAVSDPQLRLRHQIRRVITVLDPPWCKRIQHGRREAAKFMPPDVAQVFRESGLLDDWTDEIVEWWDDLALAIRSRRMDANLKTGRSAERRSFEYEISRTNRQPRWQSIESNFAGYDILSIVEEGDPRPLKIEVKGSSLPLRDAFFAVTRHEWETAITQGNYCFHLWRMDPPAPSPIVVTAERMVAHIAEDRGDGRWDQIKIPFSTFTRDAPPAG